MLGPAPTFAEAPACTEYCYDPIPDAGGAGPDGPGEAGTEGTSVVPTNPATKAENPRVSKLKQVLEVEGGAGSRVKEGTRERGNEEGVPVQDDAQPSSGEAGTAINWILVVALLGVATVAILYRAFGRSGRTGLRTPDVLIRVFGLLLGIVILLLLSPGISGASAASAPRSFFGMMSIEQITEADAERMAAGGVSTYRFPISWDGVQPSPSSGFNWASIDQTVSASSKAGLRVLPIMSGTPKGFASKYTTLPISSTRQKEGWAAFLRAAIARYGPSGDFWRENPTVPKTPIRTWQVWNEANFFYFTVPVLPANYLKLLKASHKVIKQEDPGAKVMLSGLYGSPPNQPKRAMKSWQFLDKLYDLGAKGYFDSVAIHPYTPDTQQLKLLLERVRKTLNQNGAKGTPIDITEIGWGSDRKTAFGKGTTQAQAQQLTSGYDYLLANRRKLGIRSAYWFAWKDMPRNVETCNFCYSSGLFYSGSGLKPKPAWDAFIRITGGARS